MHRTVKLQKKVDSIVEKLNRSGQTDALLQPGEQFVVIASFDIYTPTDLDAAMPDHPHVVLMPADAEPRQSKLDELHGRLIHQLNQWAKRRSLLKEGEQVCVDVFIRRVMPSTPIGEA